MNNKDYIDEKGGLQTRSMLEDGFFANIGKSKGKLKQELTKQAKTTLNNVKPIPNANTEEILLEAYNVRDALIESVSGIQLGTRLAENLTSAVNSMGSLIVRLGGEAENFDPLSQRSGLQAPNMKRNVERVIENTKDSYALGEIDEARIEEGSIIIGFSGVQEDTKYKAVGTIAARKGWTGAEAVDYVYMPGGGKMSVKVANNNGQWIDRSDDYGITWELFEDSGSSEAQEMPPENIEKNSVTKEEPEEKIANNVVDEINDDFPIKES